MDEQISSTSQIDSSLVGDGVREEGRGHSRRTKSLGI